MGTERIFIGITAYDRPNMLADLLVDINRQREANGFGLDVRIYDDGSDYDPEVAIPGLSNLDYVRYHRHEHRGKRGFWRTMNQVVQDAEQARYDYFFVLQDDLRLTDYFFEKAVLTWEAISDPDKLALSTILTPEREGRKLWNGCEPEIREFPSPPVPKDEIRYRVAREQIGDLTGVGWDIPAWRTDWVDCIWMSDGRFARRMGGVAKVDEARWDQDPNKSSGVGAQITWWGNKLGWNFYQVPETLVHHGDHPSKMNPTSRNTDHLVTHG